jgi:4-amino-4-deoxy-L-arabinose transferase-like glycosyltransferase
MPPKDFDAARKERLRQRDPMQFVLQGDVYTCVPVVPVGVGFDLADEPEPDPENPQLVRGFAMFIDNILIEEDRERFQAALRRRDDPVWRALSILLWLTWLPVAAGGRFYEHYFLQFVPPLAMLSAPGAAGLAARWRESAQRTRRLALGAVAVPLAVWLAFSWGRGIAGAYPAQEPRTRALAGWLRANTAATDTLFVWGHYSPIYTLSGRMPGSSCICSLVRSAYT